MVNIRSNIIILILPTLLGCRLLSYPVDAANLLAVKDFLKTTDIEEVRYNGKILTWLRPGVYFEVGHTLYVDKDRWNSEIKSAIDIQSALTHESVHAKRQEDYGVTDWIMDYVLSPDFRWIEESIAYTAEWKFILDHGYIFTEDSYKEFASSASGPDYNGMISYQIAYDFMKGTVATLSKGGIVQ
jgi:hypothetical protein